MNTKYFINIDNALEKLGFVKEESERYSYSDLTFRFENYWPILEQDLPDNLNIDPLNSNQLGQPGLWKYTVGDNVISRRFDIPPEILGLSLEEFISWAILTSDQRRFQETWRRPLLEELDLKKEDFVVQYDRFIRRIHLVNENQTLALRLSILPVVPELDKYRLQCLRDVLIDAQNRWRLLRITLGSPGESIEAEINFSGAPQSILRNLIKSGLNVLSLFMKWLIASVDLLANVSLKSNIFKKCCA
ncbi:hypothetical protein AYK24_07280 [Thermoplasmatales archaeon SG8-52-4]|nr:MAG: hypothetical protein AYK24_07280 [Thermoplasmatales archaeon SG8-52-4]